MTGCFSHQYAVYVQHCGLHLNAGCSNASNGADSTHQWGVKMCSIERLLSISALAAL